MIQKEHMPKRKEEFQKLNPIYRLVLKQFIQFQWNLLESKTYRTISVKHIPMDIDVEAHAKVFNEVHSLVSMHQTKTLIISEKECCGMQPNSICGYSEMSHHYSCKSISYLLLSCPSTLLRAFKVTNPKYT